MPYTNTEKRKILTSALFQHSTKLQSFKHSAMDRIVERIMFFSNNRGIEIHEIQGIFRQELGYNLPISTFENSITRLVDLKRVEPSEVELKYRLAHSTKGEFETIQAISEKSFTKIINKLFHNAPTSREVFIEPFWFSMNHIFSEVGEYSAKLVEGTIEKETVLKPILSTCIARVKSLFKIDYEYFFKRLEFFFNETNEPLYNEFRWVLAQNYFITNSLGINPESETFSKELFENMTFYLDTNVILSLISVNDRFYNNVISFIYAANKLNIKFCICKITFEELERWINAESDRILIASNQIPKTTKSKIGSCIYQELQLKIEKEGTCTVEEKQVFLNEIVQKYLSYKEIIEKIIPAKNIEYIDNEWFDAIEDKQEYTETLKLIKEKYFEVRHRKKGENASKHDAKILLWLQEEQKSTEGEFRFVTSDYSLPLIKLQNTERSDSIILEAVLQWLVPLTSNGDSKENFSKALMQRILPKEFMFEVKDFMIFEELHMECGELPAEDVEDCILFLKKNAPNLNPNEPADREVLANHIAKYFVDPGRKYKKELVEKEQENEKLAKQLGDVFKMVEKLKIQSEAKDEELEKSNILHTEEVAEIKERHEEKLTEVLDTLSDVSNELGTLKGERRQDKIDEKMKQWKKPALFALFLFIVLILFGILEFIPDWGWNYPAKLLAYFNSLGEESKGTFNVCIGLNIFLLSGLIIYLFIFFYNRLFNKEKIEAKVEYFEERIK